MESRDDSTNAERILRNITPVAQLVKRSFLFSYKSNVYFLA